MKPILSENTNEPNQTSLLIAGWREWCALPELGLMHIKAKLDTGARTSVLHAFDIEPFKDKNHHKIKFHIHPLQLRTDVIVTCTADVYDVRWVSDSGGHRERRYVILTPLKLGGQIWPIEITLTNRDTMRFRMLIGRTAIQYRLMVNPARSFLLGS